MRIALVSQEYPPQTAKGGIGSQTFVKAHGLSARGHEVHVISRSTDSQRSVAQDGKVRVRRIPGLNARMAVHTEAADWVGYSVEVAAAVATLHTESPLDLVDFPEWGAEGYTHLLNRTEWNRIPTVIQLHGPVVMFAHTMGWPALDSEFYRTSSAMERTCLQLADAVYSSSACSADWCAKHYGLKRAAIPIIHTGVDTDLFAPTAASKAPRPTIIFAGKLVRNKGVYALVEAACRLALDIPDLQVRLLGRVEPSIATDLKKMAASAGRPDLLDLAGFVERSQLPEHFSRAHVFAAPSEYEGGPGFVYLEAMACGLPAIACAGSGAAEVVKHGETGLLVPPNDVGELTTALRTLLTDEERCCAMGERARHYVLAEADSRKCVDKLEAFYTAVIVQQRRGGTS